MSGGMSVAGHLPQLAEIAHSWGIALSDEQQAHFATYLNELQRWNEHTNLTAITEREDIITRHFLDSLWCARVWGDMPRTLVDIGSGAGFPGLPLKIAFPSLHVTIVESIKKKTAFVEHMVSLLGLTDVQICTDRAEVLGRHPSHRQHYDVAVARAVADTRVLAEYCLPLVRVGGRVLAPKGGDCHDEVHQATTAVEQLGGAVLAIEPVHLPAVEPRTVVILAKKTPTPSRFPRATGVPARRPL